MSSTNHSELCINTILTLLVIVVGCSTLLFHHTAYADFFDQGRRAYERGDYPAALRKFKQSTVNKETGFQNSQAYIGRIYEHGGRGIGINKQAALLWYRRAASNGSNAALKAIARIRSSDNYDRSASNATINSGPQKVLVIVLAVIIGIVALIFIPFFANSPEKKKEKEHNRKKKEARSRKQKEARSRKKRKRSDEWGRFIDNVKKIAGDPSQLYSRFLSELSGVFGDILYQKNPEKKGHAVGQRLVKLLILLVAVGAALGAILVSVMRYLIVFLFSIVPGIFVFISSLFKREYIHPLGGSYSSDSTDDTSGWYDEDEAEDEDRKESYNADLEWSLGVVDLVMPTTLTEVQMACRRKRSMYHPDRVANMGPELQETAHQKIKEINVACDFLKEYFKNT